LTDQQEPAERGRYALFVTPEGPVIARATGLCDTCQGCGCGQQQEPISMTPAGVMKLIKQHGIKMPSPRELMSMMGGKNGG